MTSRIEIAREIILLVSPNERFVEVFKENVNENGFFPFRDYDSVMLYLKNLFLFSLQLEPCIGCYSTQANVKINQGCQQQQGRQQVNRKISIIIG